MTSLFLADINNGQIALAGVIGTFVLVTVAVAFSLMASVAKSRQREHTRREIAAYVAEGTISPQDAAALLAAGTPVKRGPDAVVVGISTKGDAFKRARQVPAS